VIVAARVTRIGRTSITMEHAVWSTAQQAIVADGHSTVVVFDYVAHQKREVPATVRATIEQLEGREI
jgi:acyl-CoA thioester hydrolase